MLRHNNKKEWGAGTGVTSDRISAAGSGSALRHEVDV
jgi:hypothetical protein